MATRTWLAGILAIAAAALTLPLVGEGGPTAYNSGNWGELISTLPVYPTGAVTSHVVFCIDLGTAPAGGAVLAATGDFEVTNDLTYWPMVGGQILLAASCSSTTGVEITENNGYNCLPQMHHCVVSRSGTLVVATGNTRRYVVLSAFALRTSPSPGDYVEVEPDYGRLSVLRWD